MLIAATVDRRFLHRSPSQPDAPAARSRFTMVLDGESKIETPQVSDYQIRAWTYGDALLEWHRYPPGPAETAAAHAHDDYQLCLSLDFPGEYRARGTRLAVPVGSLSIIHPDEVHACRDPDDRPHPTTFRLLYVPSATLQAAVRSIDDRPVGAPFFADRIILDRGLAGRFLRFHTATEAAASRLEQDTRFLSLLAEIVRHHGDTRLNLPRAVSEPHAVARIQEYLEAHYADDPSLAELGRLVSLSPFHLARVFRAEVGLSPHAYLIGVRIARAKELLVRGTPVGRVAVATGFFDQSHLTRHFKRLVGISPGRYALHRKNVQVPPRRGY